MNTFQGIATIYTGIRFTGVEELSISGVASRPVTLSPIADSLNYRATLLIDAASSDDAEAKLEQSLRRLVNLLALFFRDGTARFSIHSVENIVGGTTAYRVTLNGSAFVCVEADPARQSEFQDLVTSSSTHTSIRQDRDNTLLQLYREGMASGDQVRKFWNAYSILLILKGDRPEIDKWLQQSYPQLPLLVNDFETQRRGRTVRRTVITCMRDTFSHDGATFGGNTLDMKSELDRHAYELLEIARELLIRHL